MSALGGGGQAQQDLIEAIRGLSRTLSEAGSAARGTQSAAAGFAPGNIGALAGGAIGGPFGAAAGEAIGNNLFVNTAMKAGRDFALDTASNVAGDFAKYGTSFGNSFQESLAQGAVDAATHIQFFGDVASEVTGPQQRAAARVKGQLSPGLRAGATYSDDQISEQFQFYLKQEQREEQGVKNINRVTQNEENLGAAIAGSPRFNELTGEVASLIEVVRVFSATIQTANAAGQMLAGGGR